jgi:RNA polymerase sigma-70 factor (ECF subfamily)
MTAEDAAALEAGIKEKWEAGDLQGAATEALRGYGLELLSYLVAITRDESEASEVYSAFCEAMWSGLPDFHWQCTFRTWAYVLARHALFRRHRDPFRNAGRAVPLSRAPEVFKIADDVRSRTLIFLRSEVKDRVALLREQLEPDDQSLIILRINRRLSWDEIARIMYEEETEPSAQQLRRKAAALRKQFQRAKERLRRLVEQDRILES